MRHLSNKIWKLYPNQNICNMYIIDMKPIIIGFIVSILVILIIIFSVILYQVNQAGGWDYFTGRVKKRPMETPKYCDHTLEKDGNLCYPACEQGYKSSGANCWSVCPEGYTDDGTHCNKDVYDRGVGKPPSECPAGQEKKGEACYEKCPTNYHWVDLECVQDCPQGYEDQGGKCKAKNYNRGMGQPVSDCPKGYEKKGSLCYEKCPVGYHWVNLECVKDCPAGFKDTGHQCTKDTYGRSIGKPLTICSEGLEKKGALCYEKCPTGFHWFGLDCVKDCPAGFKDAGHNCTKDSYGRGVGRIPDKKPCSTWDSSWRDDGTSCWSDPHIYGKGCCCTIFNKKCCHNCKTGYKDDGCTCRKTNVGLKKTLMDRMICKDDEDLIDGLCYKKCKSGYKGSGPVCWSMCPDGMTDLGVSCQKNGLINRSSHSHPMICQSDEDNEGLLCYSKCKEGYNGVGPICWQICPTGMKDIGVSCQKNGTIDRSAQSKPLTCNPSQVEEDGVCYLPCAEGYHGHGSICWAECPAGMSGENGECLKGESISRKDSSHPLICQTNEVMENNLCFTKCKDGYTGQSSKCLRNCPTNMKDLGTSCAKISQPRGIGRSMICGGEFPEKIGELCYGRCPEGYKPNKDTCIKQ